MLYHRILGMYLRRANPLSFKNTNWYVYTHILLSLWLKAPKQLRRRKRRAIRNSPKLALSDIMMTATTGVKFSSLRESGLTGALSCSIWLPSQPVLKKIGRRRRRKRLGRNLGRGEIDHRSRRGEWACEWQADDGEEEGRNKQTNKPTSIVFRRLWNAIARWWPLRAMSEHEINNTQLFSSFPYSLLPRDQQV